MKSYANDFGPFGGRIWLNCAHQGPLTRAAVSAAQDAIERKANPSLIGDNDFTAVPAALKASLARLINANPEDIILGNSTSYGLHLLRNGIYWHPNDEVLLVQGDFPATIYPWLDLQTEGVRVRLLQSRGQWLTADDLVPEIKPSTRLVCVSWVNSFSGAVLDLDAIGQLCRDRGVLFVVNGSQGVGTIELNVQSEPIDAVVSCGYKWLCGPYGTGFCWVRPEVRNRLKARQTYWLPHAWGKEDLTSYAVNNTLGSCAFDVFCTANFLNFVPWRASIEYLLSVGVEVIEQHNRTLVEKLQNEIMKSKYRVISPSHGGPRSSILAVSHMNQERNQEVHAALANAGIDLALRNGNLRFSPHIYNDLDEADRAIALLNSVP